MHCFKLIFGLGFGSTLSILASSESLVWASGVEFWLIYAAQGDESITTGQRLRLWTVCGIMDDSLIVVLWPFLALAVVRSSWIGSGASVKLSSPANEYASELVQTWLSCP
jgi:hypothetical protein